VTAHGSPKRGPGDALQPLLALGVCVCLRQNRGPAVFGDPSRHNEEPPLADVPALMELSVRCCDGCYGNVALAFWLREALS